MAALACGQRVLLRLPRGGLWLSLLTPQLVYTLSGGTGQLYKVLQKHLRRQLPPEFGKTWPYLPASEWGKPKICRCPVQITGLLPTRLKVHP